MLKSINKQRVDEEAFGLLSDGGVIAFKGLHTRLLVVPVYIGTQGT